MEREQLSAWITAQLPSALPGISKQFPEFIIPPDQLHALAQTVKEHPDLRMDYLFCLTAIDRKDAFYVVYHLTSTVYQHTLVLKAAITDKINPGVDTVSDIWPAAEFYEREVYDLFGITFIHHPDLRRIFLEDDWQGYPLRKDYKDSFTLEA